MRRPRIVAAGCLVTRQGIDGTEVLLVHRPRYNDWSLPKGKAEDGEHVTQTAVREVHEETGLVVVLRRPLPMQTYLVDGVPKDVHYWRALVAQEAEFVPSDEVNKIRWLSVEEAARRVSRPDDALLVNLADEPPGTPFLVLRHGNAVKRVDWSGDAVDRPLDASGAAQADVLVGRLMAYGVERVHSSAARRCSDTVRPYSLAAGVPLAAEPALSEAGYRSAPDAALERAGDLLADGWCTHEAAVLCGHRPYLPALVDHLVELCPGAPSADPWDHPLPDTMPTASMTVLHVHQDERTGQPVTVALEHHPR
ncbi:MAG: NUDIX hydrolase [Actinomycetia bacterium]|nr:NUDIX hydrolase [Actinomycetes bacterium]